MRNKNSFTSQVKEELASNVYTSGDRLRALLSAYIRINGSLVFRHKKTLLQLNTENAKIGRFIFETINEIYHANAELIVKEKRNLDKSKSYIIEIADASEAIMDDLEISFLEGKISKNIVKNGSFEYADALSEWKDGTGAAMSADNFTLQTYPGSDELYLESKGDGDESSANSISMSWRISSKRTYVFGYSVKNSTDVQTTENHNLKITLSKSAGTKEVEVYPSYDGNWTDVQYVFTNSDSYSKLLINFSHLSEGGNNTCLDNFYLAEVEVSAGVDQIRLDYTDGNVYDLNGRKVGTTLNGFIIKDGKKYLIK